MFGSKKEGGMAHAIHKKYFDAKAPERDEDSSPDYSHTEAMHDAMHELHQAVHKGDTKRMARAFQVAHHLARHYGTTENMTDEERQDADNGDIGISAGYTGYS